MQTPDLDWIESEESSKIDFPRLIQKIKNNLFYCVLCVVIFLAAALLYLYSTNPTYNTVATVLIKDDNGQMGSQQGNGLAASLQDLGLIPGRSNVDNEQEIITSYPLVLRVVKDMQLYMQFTTREGFRKKPLYKETLPFNASISNFNISDLKDDQLIYEITLRRNSGFVIQSEGKNWNGVWGQPIHLPIGSLTLTKDTLSSIWDSSKIIILTVNDLPSIADALQNSIQAEISNKQTSIIDLSLPTFIPQQGIDVMNRLIDVYQQSNIDDNNRITDSTIQFINGRLTLVGGELDSIEANIQRFKQNNDLADLPAQSQALITNAGVYAQGLASQEVQLSVVNSLLNYMDHHKDSEKVVPASLTISDASVSATIDRYNTLLLQKERLLLSATNENPVVINLEKQIAGLRSSISSGLESIKRSMEAGLSKMKQNTGSLDNLIRQVPAKERTFVEYSRQQSIKQELYLYLLQKREESLISKSSTISNARIIVPGRIEAKPLAPNKKLILAVALFLGLVLPFIISGIRDLTNVKIRTREDIEKATKTPVLAEIIHNDFEMDKIAVTATSRDPMAEQFRILRTDLNFLLPNPNEKVILFTSSMPNEGKSFVSLNLSAMTAFSGKKVIILELDLRKPKLSKKLIMNINKGYSHYAIGQANIDDIIYPVEGYPGLSIMPSGPLPPNPAELILLERTKELFEELRKRYDYIIIDTTPYIVADARLLSRYADVTLFLVRVDLTYKEQLNQIDNLFRENKLPRLNLIVNDVNNNRKLGYYYGYGKYGYYGYGYGYGYFGEEEKKRSAYWWKRKKRKHRKS